VQHLPTAGTPGVEDDDSFAQAAIRSVSKQSVDLGSISEKRCDFSGFPCASDTVLMALHSRSLSLAKKLRALSHAEFVALAQETYLGLLACIELVNLQAQVLVSEWQTNRREEAERRQRRRGVPAETPSANPISSSSHLAVPSGLESSPSPSEPTNSLETRSTTSEDANTLANEITDVVHAVAELANVRFSKVIGVRTEVHAQLALADFVQIFDLSWDFVVQCERICQRMIVGLRGAMVAQAKTFLQAFHQRQITENARVVEEEQWAAVEVAPTVQASVACIIQIATSDPPELLLGSRSSTSSASSTASGSFPPDTESTEDPSAKTVAGPAKQIDIEGKQFFAVSAGLTTIVALMEYLKVLVNAPMLTTDVMSKIIEFMKVCVRSNCLEATNAASAHLATSGRSLTLARAKWSSAPARCARLASRTSQLSISVSWTRERSFQRARD
jgi:vacuolar protein sorting-associated protein 54